MSKFETNSKFKEENLSPLNFTFVSDFDIRISNFFFVSDFDIRISNFLLLHLQLQVHIADLNNVVQQQLLLLTWIDASAVDIGAVGAVEVLDGQSGRRLVEMNDGVLA